MKENSKINDNELNNVTGGFVFNASNISGSDPAKPWEVIDNKNGNVLARYATRDEAVAQAASYHGSNYDTVEIDWNGVVSLRNNPIA